MQLLRFKELLIIHCVVFICNSAFAQIPQLADSILINDTAISSGHIGISIYEPATNTYLYNYNATKYFVPASNVKLFTCYAGMKYLEDSLVSGKVKTDGRLICLTPTGDPTFLHPDFPYQPLLNFLASGERIWIEGIFVKAGKNAPEAYGPGWAADDYTESYMTERSVFPIYGNVVWFSKTLLYPPNLIHDTLMDTAVFVNNKYICIKPKIFANNFLDYLKSNTNFSISRNRYKNDFFTIQSDEKFNISKVPFITYGQQTTAKILESILNKKVSFGSMSGFKTKDSIIHSQPTDSLLKPMMHRSDNFFAEQTLLMVSNEHLGYMNDEAVIDTILKTDLKDIPQKPKWVDGCGLSRYNLFTPQSFVYILNKMKNEFGLKRLEMILPTGGEGTLKNYYLKDSGYIYAKTGSMNNIVCLSGLLVTQKNKLLIFSILANNFQSDGAPIRRAIELFLENIRQKF